MKTLTLLAILTSLVAFTTGCGQDSVMGPANEFTPQDASNDGEIRDDTRNRPPGQTNEDDVAEDDRNAKQDPATPNLDDIINGLDDGSFPDAGTGDGGTGTGHTEDVKRGK